MDTPIYWPEQQPLAFSSPADQPNKPNRQASQLCYAATANATIAAFGSDSERYQIVGQWYQTVVVMVLLLLLQFLTSLWPPVAI